MEMVTKLSIARASIQALKDEIAGLQKYITELRPYCNNCAHTENMHGECDECHRKYFNWKHKKIFST